MDQNVMEGAPGASDGADVVAPKAAPKRKRRVTAERMARMATPVLEAVNAGLYARAILKHMQRFKAPDAQSAELHEAELARLEREVARTKRAVVRARERFEKAAKKR